MVEVSTTAAIFGWLGTIMADVLYFSGNLDVNRSRKAGTVELFPSYVLFLTLCNAFGWVFYGTVTNQVAIIRVNGIGAPLVTIAILRLYFAASSKMRRRMQREGIISAFGVVVLAVLVLVVTSGSTARAVSGWVATLVALVMFGGPIAELRDSFRKNSVAKLPLAFICVAVINCAMWGIYGLLIVPPDAFVWGPNIAGLLLALVQAVSFGIIWRRLHKSGHVNVPMVGIDALEKGQDNSRVFEMGGVGGQSLEKSDASVDRL